MSEQKDKNRRKHMRFSLKELGVGYLELKQTSEEFSPNLVGLVADESLQGTKLVFLHAERVIVGEIYRVQVGNLSVMRAKAQWCKDLDGGIRVIGFEYLE